VIDFAFKSVRLKLSTEPISGFVAPARTTTPYLERAIPIRESGRILPPLISPTKDPGGAAITSNASPELIRRTNSALRPVVMLSLCPELFSNSGPIAVNTFQTARDAKTPSSAACTAPCTIDENARQTINVARCVMSRPSIGDYHLAGGSRSARRRNAAAKTVIQSRAAASAGLLV
jgi:hypothetical protein